MTFQKWYDDMCSRYLASYSGYEDLLEEAFNAGALAEREACAKVCDVEIVGDEYATALINSYADTIRARGENGTA